MRRSYVILIPAIVVAATALAVTQYRGPGFPLFSERATDYPADPAGESPGSSAELVARYAARVDERFRLGPDARFLGAFRELERIAIGGAPQQPTARLEDDRWILESGGRPIARDLPEFPSFADWLAALDAHARELQHTQLTPAAPPLDVPPALVARFATWDDREILTRLSELNASWAAGERSAANLAAAARGLAGLSLLLADELQVADSVPSRALAALALARQTSPDAVIGAEILLAIALDYSAHAADRAARLAPDDPLALLARNDSDGLAARAARNGSREIRYFHGLTLMYQNRFQEWRRWWESLAQEEQYSGFSARMSYTAGGIEVLATTPTVALYLANAQFAPEGFDPQQADDEVLMKRVSEVRSGISRAARAHTGPWTDAGVFEDFYRAFWLSALQHRGRFHRELRGDPEGAARFAAVLGSLASHDAQALARWYAPLIDPKAPITDRDALMRQLTEPSVLGPEQREQTLERLIRQDGSGEHLADNLLAELARHFDGRPTLLVRAADLARRYFQDIALAERLEAPGVRLNPHHHPWRRARLAQQQQDSAELWAMVESPSREARERALLALADLPEPDLERIQGVYAKEWSARRDSEDLVGAYANFLAEDRKEYVRAAELLRDYLARNDDGSLGAAVLHKRASAYYRKAGDARAAWGAIEPALASYKGDVLDEGVRVLVARGRLEEAETLARRRYERYVQSLSSPVTLAYVLWHRERDQEAAELLVEVSRGTSLDSRRAAFSRGFAEAFGNAPQERVLRAFQAMVDAGIEFYVLLDCVKVLASGSSLATSFEMSQRIRQPDSAFAIYMAGYPGLVAQRGEPAAAQWMVENMGASELNLAAIFFFGNRKDDLLWTTFEIAQTRPDATTWRWRAAAAARGAKLTPERRAALNAYYAQGPATFEDRIGRTLVGASSEQELLAAVRRPSELCQAAYALSLRAFGEGRYRDGARWLQIAIATRSGQTREYVRSLDDLRDLVARNTSLTVLERQHAATLARR